MPGGVQKRKEKFNFETRLGSGAFVSSSKYPTLILSSPSSMSLSLVSNSYLEETSAKIRSKPVPWEVRVVSQTT